MSFINYFIHNILLLILCLLLIFQSTLKCQQDKPNLVDIIVFSYDRPLMLYSFLESLQKHTINYNNILIIYRISDGKYDQAYNKCLKCFKNLNIIALKQNTENFEMLTKLSLKCLTNEYVAFAVDDIIVTDFINFNDCAMQLDQTNAYGFYLRLGENITYCYNLNISTPPPTIKYHSQSYILFQLNEARGDWSYPCSLDMTVFKKSNIINEILSLRFNNPNQLECNWTSKYGKVNRKREGIAYNVSKIVNIPLSIVQTEFVSNKNMNFKKEDLLDLFNNNLKIDVSTLFKLNNNSPHMEITPQFISKSI